MYLKPQKNSETQCSLNKNKIFNAHFAGQITLKERSSLKETSWHIDITVIQEHT